MDIKLSELIRIHGRGKEISEETKEILFSWKQELDKVIANLGANTELGAASERLNIAIENALRTIKGDRMTEGKLDTILGFINTQITNYSASQEIAQQSVEAVINNLSDVISTNIN